MNLEKCNICPRNCKVDRLKGNIGYCRCNDKIKIALASIHYYEEPCISKENGSGTVFFSNCNLNCIYCQNYEISQKDKGREITVEQLAQIFLKQQAKGVNNINLVTPTMYAKHIKEALMIAKNEGLSIPVIYNTNGYESIETLKELEGLIDIYLPDLKYYSNELSKKYSKVDNYFDIATKAIQEMNRQVGRPTFNEKGIIQKGMMIRHLILPNHLQNTKHILKWIKESMPAGTYVSVMAQYFPTYQAKQDESINRKLTNFRFRKWLYTRVRRT